MDGSAIPSANDVDRGQPPHFRVLGVPLSPNKLLWACHRYYAVEFLTWAPLPDEDRLRFARIHLEAPPGTPEERTKAAALAVRAALQELGLDAVPGNAGTLD